ncbi:RlpA-like double-psi beta-barrel-protein domain-containing protein-containing protein [Apodospora peruviana]|uniref:RlpA-like double-psi beta-barrel-protein domain-containing protein-containing protein n=1 Tax=Apodospora peruviana TaxID=516989 RepID=A0AAE0HWH2_9PEZI|nr:RlpA-like double-psi beta-barrel-protein domain-containing protein-containing protein [Apodospora peruviana]
MYFSKTLAATALLSLLSLGSAAPAAAPEENTSSALTARAISGEFTWYHTGLGACGWTNSESEFVVALGHDRFDPETPNGNPNRNRLCGRRVRANYNGRTIEATVVDRCAHCQAGDLDLSPAAFRVFASQDAGRIRGTWDFI